MNFYNIFLVGVGGMLGSVARFAATRLIDARVASVFPYGTLAVNFAGSFILGVVYSWLAARSGDQTTLRLFLGVGFCGGFTTFSAFAIENVGMWQQKLPVSSAIYVLTSLILGFAGVWMGQALGKSLFS